MNPCYLNAERLNFTGLGYGKCSGMLLVVRKVIGDMPMAFYSCAGHLTEGWYSISVVKEKTDVR